MVNLRDIAGESKKKQTNKQTKKPPKNKTQPNKKKKKKKKKKTHPQVFQQNILNNQLCSKQRKISSHLYNKLCVLDRKKNIVNVISKKR